jgi:hypothetical protein
VSAAFLCAAGLPFFKPMARFLVGGTGRAE